MRILVTGGAGFIGSHLVRSLAADSHELHVIDAMVPQVHGIDAPDPSLPPHVRFTRADLRNAEVWLAALADVDAVVHLAAEVGVGQSMYEIDRYLAANTMATGLMLQAMVDHHIRPKRLVVASSMSIYGEGAYTCTNCGDVAPPPRPVSQLTTRQWELVCPTCGTLLHSKATPESKPLQPTSVYAISKRDQEELSLNIGRAYGIPTVALRFFNVFGPGQALSNPYTGVAAIFGSRLLNGRPPLIFEDGAQLRDFVHVSDVVQAIRLALTAQPAVGHAINIGSGQPRSVSDIAKAMSDALSMVIEPELVGQYREGDIRHCYADISLARRLMGYAPSADFSTSMTELAAWVSSQIAIDTVDAAKSELDRRGLTR